MNMDKNDILPLVVLLLFAVDIFFVLLLFTAKGLNRRRELIYRRKKNTLIETISTLGNNAGLNSLKMRPSVIFSIYRDISVSLAFSEDVDRMFQNYFLKTGLVDRYCKRIRSWKRRRRSEAAVNMAFLTDTKIHRALETALVKEKYHNIRIFITSALIDVEDSMAIPYILQTLIGAPSWYREKIYSIMGQFGDKFHEFMLHMGTIESKELKMLIINFSAHYFSPEIRAFLIEFMDSPDPEIAVAAAESCKKLYPELLGSEKFLKSPHVEIKQDAVEAIASYPSEESLNILINHMIDMSIHDDCVSAVYRMVLSNNELFKKTISHFEKEKNPRIKSGLATVLSRRIDYLFSRLRLDSSEKYRTFLTEIISLGSLQHTITFINENSDRKLEDEICAIISDLPDDNRQRTDEFRLYLNEGILEKLGLTRLEPARGGPRREAVSKGLLTFFLAAALIIFPLLYVARNHEIPGSLSLRETFKVFLYDFNYFFAFYGIALNSIYLLLLFFSFMGSRGQIRYWKMKNYRLLFKRGMLPSISIIAPAYGEEATIIESVNSLVNLSYPDYEVIVVNDGSTDRTLETLIEYFDLERDDIHVDEKLSTNSIRGLYRNRYMPKLLVVDKVNGGKADSLNAGINVAGKEYICGIDADSLLERDSLLKMTAPFLDSDREIIATGGNILPVNGCTVDRGHIVKIEIPGRFLPNLQTMEYIRSFISGRVGWATIHCLLIISGAFGLFRKSLVIESGGYLTGKEKYGKDTVGEDMELVVRLVRHSRNEGRKGTVNYIFNANCWTEVPESYSILRRQRDRWQRGLLDTMTFHIRMLFNPKYGTVGFIAFPYFVIFEVIGPWIEAQGLVMFIAAISLGLLDSHIILLLFIGTILMGLSVSIISFYIMERGNRFFSGRDIIILLFYSFIENFGIRQFISISRLGGYINVLRNRQGWGKMVRKGFKSRPEST